MHFRFAGVFAVPGNHSNRVACPGLLRLEARRHSSGFTLIELIVTMAVLAILLTIAVPSFRHIIDATNLADVNNSLAADLQYARTEAASRQVNIAVAASSGDWQNGWLVEVPPSGATAATVLRRRPAVSTQYVLDAGNAVDVTYQPQGSLQTPVSATTGTCFTISAPDGVHTKSHFLQVLPAGMLQQTTSDAVPAGCPSP